jgi:peptide/nickel transport system substrate-binding protein
MVQYSWTGFDASFAALSDATRRGVPFWWGMFNTLVRLDANRQPVPELAESWSTSDDRLSATFKLRPDVKFHSGRTFTADDARWSIEHSIDPKTGNAAGAELRGVDVAVLDSSTIQLRFPDLLPDIFGLLRNVLIIDPQSDIDHAPGGTGPFKFDHLSPGDELRMVRNSSYWRSGRPYLDEVVIRSLTDPNTLVVNLEAGVISAAAIRSNDLVRLKSNSRLATFVAAADGNYDYVINTTTPPFDDKRVRQAMSLAIDRSRFAKTLLYGLAEPIYVIWPRSSPAWSADDDTGEFNLNKARHLLADAGYAAGFETMIQTSSGQYPEFVKFNEVLQADLASIGVKASIENLEQQAKTALLRDAKFPAIFQHGIYAFADSDPAMLFTALVFRPDGNVTHFHSDQYSQLISSARAEPEWTKRMALYRRVAQLVKDESFVLPVCNGVLPYAMQSNVQGFGFTPGTGAYPIVYEDIWLA